MKLLESLNQKCQQGNVGSFTLNVWHLKVRGEILSAMPISCGINKEVGERDDEHSDRRGARMTRVEDDMCFRRTPG